MAEVFLRQYEIFFKKSKIDLASAKTLLKSFENGNSELEQEVIFFHLQQCAVEGRYSVIHDDLDDTDKYIIILDHFLEKVRMDIKL